MKLPLLHQYLHLTILSHFHSKNLEYKPMHLDLFLMIPLQFLIYQKTLMTLLLFQTVGNRQWFQLNYRLHLQQIFLILQTTPPSKSDIPEPPSVPEQPIPAPFVDLNEPSPAPPTDPENLEAVPPTVLDELAPSPRAFPDESVNQGPPNFFDLPPPFGIPGPLGPEDLQGIPPPFSPFGQPDDSSLVGLPSPFGLPGPFGAPVDINGPSDSFGFSGPAGFYGFPNFPGSDFSATSLNDENSPEDIQGLYDSPLTNGGETEGGFPPIPGILPGFPPAPAQNPPQSFKQPPDLVPDISPPEIRIKPDQTSPNVSNPSLDIPPETAAKVDKSVEPIPGLISGFFSWCTKSGAWTKFSRWFIYLAQGFARVSWGFARFSSGFDKFPCGFARFS